MPRLPRSPKRVDKGLSSIGSTAADYAALPVVDEDSPTPVGVGSRSSASLRLQPAPAPAGSERNAAMRQPDSGLAGSERNAALQNRARTPAAPRDMAREGRAELREHFLLADADGTATLDREEWEKLFIDLQSLLQEDSSAGSPFVPDCVVWFNQSTGAEELGAEPSISYEQFEVYWSEQAKEVRDQVEKALLNKRARRASVDRAVGGFKLGGVRLHNVANQG